MMQSTRRSSRVALSSIAVLVATALASAQTVQTNATFVPTTKRAAAPSQVPQITAGTCINGMVGDTTIAGGWTAFEAASGKTMEVLNSGVSDFTDIFDINTSLGLLTLSGAHNKRTIGSGWGSWSHGYTGEVFYNNGVIASTYTMPAGCTALDMYIEPNPFAIHTFDAIGLCSDGSTLNLNFTADGSSGANHFGFWTSGSNTLVSVAVTGTSDWAVGEWRVSGDLETCINGMVGDTTIAGGWTAFEAASGKTMEVLNSGVSDFTDIFDINTSLGLLTLSSAHNKRTIGSGWGSWSHGYTGEVFYNNGVTAATYTMPAGCTALDMYIEPNPFAIHTFDAVGLCSDGSTLNLNFTADGSSGANHFGFWTSGSNTLVSVAVTGTSDWAVGEWRVSGGGGTVECVNYCTSTANSTGGAALISSTDGCDSDGDGMMDVQASPVPNQPGIFFSGTIQLSVPFGNGLLCTAGSITRHGVVFGAGNVATATVDISSLTGPSYMQYWFRDPAAGGAFFDTSDAMTTIP